MPPPAARRALVNGAVAFVFATGVLAGVAAFSREIRSDRRGAPSTTFPPEMDRFRRSVLASLPPGAGVVFLDSGDDPWVEVLVERALFPHPVWTVFGPPEEIDASLRRLMARTRLRFAIVAGPVPTSARLRRARPLPRLSGFSSPFLFGELER
ncbi:MAG TPA: hypothetical protein VKH46_09300 [Thermoanaerobaculia bacterium]|jgi:hypothetical protein|nr:hypothetical protein [Thermoanaerobaculia bacterium]